MLSSLQQLAKLAYFQQDYTAARDLAQQSLAIAQRLGDVASQAVSLGLMGSIERREGNLTQAQRFFEEALSGLRQIAQSDEFAAALLEESATVREAQKAGSPAPALRRVRKWLSGLMG